MPRKMNTYRPDFIQVQITLDARNKIHRMKLGKEAFWKTLDRHLECYKHALEMEELIAKLQKTIGAQIDINREMKNKNSNMTQFLSYGS